MIWTLNKVGIEGNFLHLMQTAHECHWHYNQWRKPQSFACKIQHKIRIPFPLLFDWVLLRISREEKEVKSIQVGKDEDYPCLQVISSQMKKISKVF